MSALVVDIGTSSVRAGYAGDDTPKAVISSYYGYKPTAGDPDAKLYLGQNGPSIWRDGMEIANPMRDGLSQSLNHIINSS